jgi:mono/diheme cytochrome c family protein
MSRWIKRLGVVLATFVVVVSVLAGFVWQKSSSMMTKTYRMPVEHVTVMSDSTTLERGHHLATAISKCVECHGENFGGKVFIDDPGLGQVIASNLTKGTGGVGNKYTDDQLATTIRHGIKIDGTSALVMPSPEFQALTDDDVAAIVAYVRSFPPVNNALPKSQLRPVGRTLAVIGQLPIFVAEAISPDRPHEKTQVADTSLHYGTYLANVGGCTGCHGPGLSGGKIPGTPPAWPAAANITPSGIGRYSDDQVRTVLTTGTRPDGTHVNDVMPWKATRMMTADEITATIKYLRSVPAKQFGGR